MKGVVLTPARQMIFAAIGLGLLTWVAISSIAIWRMSWSFSFASVASALFKSDTAFAYRWPMTTVSDTSPNSVFTSRNFAVLERTLGSLNRDSSSF